MYLILEAINYYYYYLVLTWFTRGSGNLTMSRAALCCIAMICTRVVIPSDCCDTVGLG